MAPWVTPIQSWILVQKDYRIAGNFRGRKLCEKYDLRELLACAAPKDNVLPNFVEKTFANNHKTPKFPNILSLKSSPLYGIGYKFVYPCCQVSNGVNAKLWSLYPISPSTLIPWLHGCELNLFACYSFTHTLTISVGLGCTLHFCSMEHILSWEWLTDSMICRIAENFCKFRGFVAICESFLHKILGMASFGTAKAGNLWKFSPKIIFFTN